VGRRHRGASEGCLLRDAPGLPEDARTDRRRFDHHTSSTSGLEGNFGQTNYGAAKAGIAGFTRCLALEGQKFGIRVNAIAPVALTRMTEDLPLAQNEAFKERMHPRHIAPLIVYSRATSQRT